MSFTGMIKNGIVVPDEEITLPEGTRVKIEPLDNGTPIRDNLMANLLRWAGKGEGLPDDLAKNHDHYLHGRPKK